MVSDSQLLANRVDAVILVIRAQRDKRGLVSRVMHQMAAVRGEFLGLVLNAVRSEAGGYFRRNYRAFYDYYHNGASDGRSGRSGSGNGRGRSDRGDRVGAADTEAVDQDAT